MKKESERKQRERRRTERVLAWMKGYKEGFDANGMNVQNTIRALTEISQPHMSKMIDIQVKKEMDRQKTVNEIFQQMNKDNQEMKILLSRIDGQLKNSDDIAISGVRSLMNDFYHKPKERKRRK